jgi:ribonuclease HII
MAKLLPFFNEGIVEAGCDEAGRGCLAGPVVAAAVILPPDFVSSTLNDSKQLSEKKRVLLRNEIEREALAYAVAFVDAPTIDQINILQSSFLAMHNAVDALSKVPEHLLIDGNRFKPYKNIPATCVIKGDGKYLSIAAASILAKTYRDDYMLDLHHQFPVYDWISNKGYPTQKHREAIAKHGTTPFHRMSFTLLSPTQLELFA